MTSGSLPESRSVKKLKQNPNLCVEAVKSEDRHQTRECPRMPANAPRMPTQNDRECPANAHTCKQQLMLASSYFCFIWKLGLFTAPES